MNRKRMLMLCASSQNIYTFRLPLIRKFEEEGYEVYVVAFDDDYKKELAEEQVKFICLKGDNRSANPLKILELRKQYRSVIEEVKPDVVFTFVLKPNTIGVMAAHDMKVPYICSMVEGVGDPFTLTGIKWKLVKKIVCYLYRRAFRHSNRVFFLNNDDYEEFKKLRIVNDKKCTVVFGIGVDLNKFAARPVNADSNRFIMVARMLVTKGVEDYCKAAELVREKHPEAEFLYLGGEGTVKVSDISDYINKGNITYMGNVKDVRPYLVSSLMLLLPSYREGMPMSIMEAQAVGRGIITTDSIGCRDTVREGYNGYLVKTRDFEAMAEKCCKILEDKQEAVRMGRNARTYAEENFDQSKINEQIVGIILEDIKQKSVMQ